MIQLRKLLGLIATLLDAIEVGNLVRDGLHAVSMKPLDLGVLNKVFFLWKQYAFDFPVGMLVFHLATLPLMFFTVLYMPIKMPRWYIIWWLTCLPFAYYCWPLMTSHLLVIVLISIFFCPVSVSVASAFLGHRDPLISFFLSYLFQFSFTIISGVLIFYFLSNVEDGLFLAPKTVYYAFLSMFFVHTLYIIYWEIVIFMTNNAEQLR